MEILGISLPTLAVALVPAYFVAKWQANTQFRNVQRQKLDDKKRGLYSDIISVFVKMTRDRDGSEPIVSSLKKYNEDILLIASNKVIKVYGDLFSSIYIYDINDIEAEKRVMVIFGHLVRAMRADLGNHGWFTKRFSWYDALRPNFTNVDLVFPSTPRSIYKYKSKDLKSVKELPVVEGRESNIAQER